MECEARQASVLQTTRSPIANARGAPTPNHEINEATCTPRLADAPDVLDGVEVRCAGFHMRIAPRRCTAALICENDAARTISSRAQSAKRVEMAETLVRTRRRRHDRDLLARVIPALENLAHLRLVHALMQRYR